MNITTKVASRLSDELSLLVHNTPEIQFYINGVSDKYQWRDSRYLETSDMFSNKQADDIYEIIEIFKTHIASKSEIKFTLQDIIDAVQYGFDYRVESMNDGKSVPIGNTLQYLMYSKKLKEVPQEFKELAKKEQIAQRAIRD